LKRVAPDIEFVPCRTAAEAAKLLQAGGADAVVGYCTPDIVKAGGQRLKWVQVGSAGVDNYLFPEMVKSDISLTNTARIYAPQIADHVFGMLLVHTRNLRRAMGQAAWSPPAKDELFQELRGKTIVIVGFGGIGTEVGRRAHGFGLRVRAIDPKEMEKPDFAFSLDKPARLMELLREADVVVVACPLTPETRGLFGAEQFRAMKPTAFFINVARGGVVQQDALIAALQSKQIAGAGLDVTDPEPLPESSPLWKMANVIITPHVANLSEQRQERLWLLWRENVRRFANGEPLLCVVDKAKGY